MEGQLCFSTNLSSVDGLPSPDQGSNKGADNFKKLCHTIPAVFSGLTLAIDYNFERGVHSGPTLHAPRSYSDYQENGQI